MKRRDLAKFLPLGPFLRWLRPEIWVDRWRRWRFVVDEGAKMVSIISSRTGKIVGSARWTGCPDMRILLQSAKEMAIKDGLP